MNQKAETLERERRWAMLAGLLSVLGVVLIAVSYVVTASQVPTGDGAAEFLTNVQDNRGGLVLVNLIQALGYLCLIAPLVYLFKAAAARSDQVKAGLIGLVIVAPVFLAGAAVANATANLQAASDFKEKSAAPVEACINEENEENGSTALGATAPESARATGEGATGTSGDTAASGATGTTGDTEDDGEPKSGEDIATDCADETAENFQQDASTRNLTVGLGLAGALGFTISIVYIALWTMRVGLMTRFWGSLGMALGAVSILFPQFTLLWFIFIGFLITGFVPGGRPPAWEAGEAVPWPPPGTPPENGDDLYGDDVIEGSAEELDDDPDPDPDAPQIERRKRKRRNT
jgi:hypothetical protein